VSILNDEIDHVDGPVDVSRNIGLNYYECASRFAHPPTAVALQCEAENVGQTIKSNYSKIISSPYGQYTVRVRKIQASSLV
jgi:hypothetical protein